MQLWWRLRGWVRLRLTSADCAARLRAMSREIRLEDIEFHNDLTASFCISKADADRIEVREGERIEVVTVGGLPSMARRVWEWRRLAVVAVMLGVLTVLLPTRVWFIRVEGNGELPARRIMEAAEVCGVYFGASMRELRSEQVKNHLLYAIPELRWAGVNTSGCTVVITVSVRDADQTQPGSMPGDLVAGVDAVVTDGEGAFR